MGFHLFWAAFDLPMTVVPLKVALGLEQFDFWAFQKNNKKNSLGYTFVIIFLNAKKSIFSHPKASFNGTTFTRRSKAACFKIKNILWPCYLDTNLMPGQEVVKVKLFDDKNSTIDAEISKLKPFSPLQRIPKTRTALWRRNYERALLDFNN